MSADIRAESTDPIGSGSIPPGWREVPVKRALTFTTGWTPPTGEEYLYAGDIPWANIGDLGPRTLLDTQKTIAPDAVQEAGVAPSPPGSLLFAFKLSVGAVSLAGREMYTNEAIATFHPSQQISTDFLFWAAPVFIPLNAAENIYGAKLLSRERIANAKIWIPPVPSQRAIAAFLDGKTAEIDALVTKKEQLIELLEEKRTALITHAVTKGLDPNVKMKESGVEWLGEVPTHWGVARTKSVARLYSGHTPSRQAPEYWIDCTIPWFGLSDVWQIRDGRREIVTETSELISEIGLAHSAARLLPTGTVILSRTASVGFSAILGTPMATTQDFVNWVPGATITSTYLLFVFRAMENEFRRITMGSTHQTIYMPDVGRFSAPVPSIEEQNRIVAHIRSSTARIDGLVESIRIAIDRLKEYRSALITAAVTGRMTIPDVSSEAA